MKPDLLNAPILMCLLATIAHAQEKVTVRANAPLKGAAGGASDTRYTGFLHSLTPTLPDPDRFEALKPANFRTGVLTNINGGVVTGDFANYARVRAAGATFEYLMSDAVYTKDPDSVEWPGGAKDPDYVKWDALVDTKIASAKAAAGGEYVGRWDIWNEPDFSVGPGQYFWPYQDADGAQQFFETWRRAHKKVRAGLPGAQIVGPSIAVLNGLGGQLNTYPDTGKHITMDAFLKYAKANDVLPDVLTLHAFDKDAVGPRLAGTRKLLKDKRITGVALGVNEYIGHHEQTRPGVLPHYFAAMQAAGVVYGVHATWPDARPDRATPTTVSNAYNDSLNGLLTDDTKQPRSTWWVYKRYAELSGAMVQVDAGPTVNGLASVDAQADVATVLLGRDYEDFGWMPTPPAEAPTAVVLQLSGLVAAMGITGGTPLKVELQRIADSGYAAYAEGGPTSLVLPMTAGRATLNVPLADFGWTDAYFIKVTAAPNPQR
ncbi:MAG TPA: hypothetical protein VGN72_05300 [Tepidisphaeraceae bacterium]|nr:hypothetical protein [Tepidisphaeraceae bacterium]